jgi:hypothetical protein
MEKIVNIKILTGFKLSKNWSTTDRFWWVGCMVVLMVAWMGVKAVLRGSLFQSKKDIKRQDNEWYFYSQLNSDPKLKVGC